MEKEKLQINEEIAAVIAAAVASMNTRPGIRLVVKSFRRTNQSTPVWSTTGRVERLSKKL